MWKTVFILFQMLLCSVVASAQKDNLEIQLVNDAKISLSPGVTTNLGIRLVNNTGNDERISLIITMPGRWKCFSETKEIQTPKLQSTLKILSFNVPSYTMAGDYSIIIEAIDQQGVKVGEIVLPVTIVPKYELNIELIDAPDYVFAGDTLSVQFIIQNRSNRAVELGALLKGTGTDEQMDYVLNPDSSVIITRKIKTEKGILKSDKRTISLTASLTGMPEVKASKSYSYNVIPGSDVKFDPYNRFPVQFSTLFVTDNPGGKRLYALMAEVEGKDFLDEANTKELYFHFRGPDRRGQPLYGIFDEYFMKYTTPKSAYLAGDHNYMLSYLTEFSRYGRGGQAEHTFNHITIGSFINYPRFYPKIKRELAAYIGYSLPDKLILNVGFLNKLNNTGEVNNLMTFNGSGTPFKWAKLDWEYALGTVGTQYKQAVKTEVNINLKKLRLFYHYTFAEKDYPGYFSDTRNMLANANISLSRRINVGANYSSIRQNIALDTLYGSAPFSKNLFFTFNYGFMKNGGLSAAYYYRERQDGMEPMKFNFNEQSVRLSIYKRVSNFGLNLIGEYGKTENLLMPEEERLNDMYHGQMNLNYQIFNKMNISGFVDYQASKSYNFKDHKNWIYSVSVNGSVSKKLSLYFKYQSSYTIEEYYYDRDLLNGRLVYAPNENNRIEMSCLYHLTKNTMNVRQLAFEARYVHTFNVPVSKKKSVGKLVGSVINKGVKSVEGIVLSIGSDKAVTDQNGNYCFPMLPAGNYYLMIDWTKAGVFAVPDIPGPYRIDIVPGTETRYDIGLTLASAITGEIKILKEVPDGDKTYAGIQDHLSNLLVEARNGDEVYRIFSKEDGSFAFESLRPGQWTVKVYENGIPKEYELVTDVYTLALTPGQVEHLQVDIREIRRRIKFQTTFNSKVPPASIRTTPATPPMGMADQVPANTLPERK